MSKFKHIVSAHSPSIEDALESALSLKQRYGGGLVDVVTRQYEERLSPGGFHGCRHWERVLINGLLLEQALPDYVCADTIYLFALFHDSKRMREGEDPEHGTRGAAFFNECVDKGLITFREHLGEPNVSEIIANVSRACTLHSTSLFDDEPRVAACFDADRLDLERVSIYPDREKLNFQTAISRTFVYECSMRAKRPLDVPIFGGGDTSVHDSLHRSVRSFSHESYTAGSSNFRYGFLRS
ncbi:hypothetical protein BM525_20810 (plasmid) [Alteromonas mediterranea]|uniref:HD domain-containing protein n=1 Tax=Alteromonas mediterranea TaxID=314275 RepID=A0AAC9JGX3_9ALTE|nr:hypothetical protein [Alteromonas mediterranea]APD92306.1 hypothetical protein BM524_20585 [Alteromonas mediterranea]APE00167.1 hypothetical protein BM525_20810 [Alteromonas mediterranea]